MTCELEEKFVPITVIGVPGELTGALVGLTLEMVGGAERTPKIRKLLVWALATTVILCVPPTARSEVEIVA